MNMGKSKRSKVKQHATRVRRMKITVEVDHPRTAKNHALLKRVQNGEKLEISTPKNAFLHPDDKDAIIPQSALHRPIDLRQEAVPVTEYALLRECSKRPELAKSFELDEDKASYNIVLSGGKRVDGSAPTNPPRYQIANYAPNRDSKLLRTRRKQRVMNPAEQSGNAVSKSHVKKLVR